MYISKKKLLKIAKDKLRGCVNYTKPQFFY